MASSSTNERASYLYGREPSIDPYNRPAPTTQKNLMDLISEVEDDEVEASASDSVEHSSSTASSNLEKDLGTSVYLRLRPSSKKSRPYTVTDKTLTCSSGSNQELTEKQFTFSNIFQGDSSQSQIYEWCVEDSISKEENLTILTYGTSGSGKTYTILGKHEEPGIIPRAIEHIFFQHEQNVSPEPCVKIEKGNIVIMEEKNLKTELNLRNVFFRNAQEADANAEQRELIMQEHRFEKIDFSCNTFIWISFAEIYNEHVYDLLSPDLYQGQSQKENNISQQPKSRKILKIISNDGNAFIKDLTSVYVRSSHEAHYLLSIGRTRVSYATTNINANSSRSHCIFFIDVARYEHPDIFSHTSYKFCDLAGSERLKKTDNIGSRLKEAQNINNSLLVLGRCLDTVHSNQNRTKNKADIVPIRDSKLTTLLQTALLGKEKLTMIVNMMPTMEYFEENLNVLNFSSMAKQIVYKPVPRKEKMRSTRFSLLFSKNSVAANSSILNTTSDNSLLLDDNFRLKEECNALREKIRAMIEQKSNDEMKLRKQLNDEFKDIMERKDSLNSRYKAYQEMTIEKHKTRITELERELFALKHNEDSELERENLELKEKIKNLEERLNANAANLKVLDSPVSCNSSPSAANNDSIVSLDASYESPATDRNEQSNGSEISIHLFDESIISPAAPSNPIIVSPNIPSTEPRKATAAAMSLDDEEYPPRKKRTL